jgi:hypothetical protein
MGLEEDCEQITKAFELWILSFFSLPLDCSYPIINALFCSNRLLNFSFARDTVNAFFRSEIHHRFQSPPSTWCKMQVLSNPDAIEYKCNDRNTLTEFSEWRPIKPLRPGQAETLSFLDARYRLEPTKVHDKQLCLSLYKDGVRLHLIGYDRLHIFHLPFWGWQRAIKAFVIYFFWLLQEWPKLQDLLDRIPAMENDLRQRLQAIDAKRQKL